MNFILFTILMISLSVNSVFGQKNKASKKVSANKINCLSINKIKLEVINQRDIINRNHNPWATREIEFRLTNNSQCSVFVRGTQLKNFFPIGFNVEFNKRKKQWIHPYWRDKIPEFEKLQISEYENYLLKPGEFLTFTSLVDDSQLSSTKISYKRIVYLAINNLESKTEILQSPVFVVQH